MYCPGLGGVLADDWYSNMADQEIPYVSTRKADLEVFYYHADPVVGNNRGALPGGPE